MNTNNIPLQIFSDPICPWCYIGKARLDRALEARPDHPFAIEWQPFQLNPDMPREGMDRRAYLEAKFGGQKGAVQAYLPVEDEARNAGLVINFETIKRTPNTLDAHRLIHWSGLEHHQTLVVARLFRAYFIEGRDIGSHEVLADIAGEAGMSRDMVLRLLSTDADASDIMARDKDARKKGVQAVPTFVIAGQHVLSGAQPTSLWQQILEELAQNN